MFQNMRNKRLILIRHGVTMGNVQKRYVGRTDEPLLDISKEKLKPYADHKVRKVYISPMKRAYETSSLLFPNAGCIIIDEFRECDFGEYEYKNYEELNGLMPYQQYIDSGGSTAFPGGESRDEFIERVMTGFAKMSETVGDEEDVYIVAHGGTVMAIMDRLVVPHKDFHEWHVEGGEGYVIRCEDSGNYTLCSLYP